ncbi:hypothetical protein DW150_16680 [Phocaeicola vulgatus]|uniref:Uncharacterized protein n=1 Tax=Phocaeicola vulgatus TaxID=821 RepID=A0A415BMY5_PHOVU|nr:hypothetical protein DW150_16680 [Phocaeicola vulgatus]
MSVYNGVITDSKSYKKTLECILNGVTDPEVLLEQIHRRTLNRVEPDIIKDALIGIVNETGGEVIRQLKMEIDSAKIHKVECLLKINELSNKYFSK